MISFIGLSQLPAPDPIPDPNLPQSYDPNQDPVGNPPPAFEIEESGGENGEPVSDSPGLIVEPDPNTGENRLVDAPAPLGSGGMRHYNYKPAGIVGNVEVYADVMMTSVQGLQVGIFARRRGKRNTVSGIYILRLQTRGTKIQLVKEVGSVTGDPKTTVLAQAEVGLQANTRYRLHLLTYLDNRVKFWLSTEQRPEIWSFVVADMVGLKDTGHIGMMAHSEYGTRYFYAFQYALLPNASLPAPEPLPVGLTTITYQGVTVTYQGQSLNYSN